MDFNLVADSSGDSFLGESSFERGGAAFEFAELVGDPTEELRALSGREILAALFELEPLVGDRAGSFESKGRVPPPSLSEELLSFCSEPKLKPNELLPMLTSAELSEWLSPFELPVSLFAFRLRAFSSEKGSASDLDVMVGGKDLEKGLLVAGGETRKGMTKNKRGVSAD